MNDVNGNEPLNIETTDGMFEAKSFVFATHIPPGINLLHLRCVPNRSYVTSVRLASGNYPEGLIYDMKDPYHYYRTQIINGVNYLIVGGYDHKTAHKSNTSESFMQLEAHVREKFDVAEITTSGRHNTTNRSMGFRTSVTCPAKKRMFMLRPVLVETE